MAEYIDPSKDETFPVVLSDALLGRGTKELFTSIRYDPRPETSADVESQELKPLDNDPSRYALSFQDGSKQYKYVGERQSGDGNYVLIFDTVNRHYILHQIDSSFDMRMVDPSEDTIDEQPPASRTRRKSLAQPKTTPAAKKKVEKPKKKAAREPTPEVMDEDSDDGLTIEYPGGPPPKHFQRSTPLHQRGHDRAVPEVGGYDAHVGSNRDVEELHLSSPAVQTVDSDVDAGEELELDLEAELEKALANETGTGPRGVDESSESEEE